MVQYKNGSVLTATGQAITGQGKLKNIIVYSGTEGGLSAVLYDSVGAATNMLTTVGADPLIGGGSDICTVSVPSSRTFENGVYAVLTGTGVLTLEFDEA